MAGKLKSSGNAKSKIGIHQKINKIGIVVSAWNIEITDLLLQGALDILALHEISESQIEIVQVPGSFELPISARWLIDYKSADGVICLGCIIKGETDHDIYISEAVSQGIMNVSLNYGVPVSFGVLTTNDKIQALERAGGKYGNKGEEAAVTLLNMLEVKMSLLK